MNQKLLFLGAVGVALMLGSLLYSATGTGDATQLAAVGAFDPEGYNRPGRAFSGTGESWCSAQGRQATCLGEYSKSALSFTWTAGWDKGNREAWVNGPYDATMAVTFGDTDFALAWVGPCREGAPTAKGLCVWGEFAISGTEAGPSRVWVAEAGPDRF